MIKINNKRIGFDISIITMQLNMIDNPSNYFKATIKDEENPKQSTMNFLNEYNNEFELSIGDRTFLVSDLREYNIHSYNSEMIVSFEFGVIDEI